MIRKWVKFWIYYSFEYCMRWTVSVKNLRIVTTFALVWLPLFKSITVRKILNIINQYLSWFVSKVLRYIERIQTTKNYLSKSKAKISIFDIINVPCIVAPLKTYHTTINKSFIDYFKALLETFTSCLWSFLPPPSYSPVWSTQWKTIRPWNKS